MHIFTEINLSCAKIVKNMNFMSLSKLSNSCRLMGGNAVP